MKFEDIIGAELSAQVTAALKGKGEGGKDIEIGIIGDGTTVPVTQVSELNETIKGLQGQIADRDKDITELKKGAGDNTELAQRYTELETKYKTDTEELNGKIQTSQLNAKLDLGITKAKGKNPTAIKALIDQSKLSVKDDGSIDGLDAALEAIKTSDAYLFEQVETRRSGAGFHNGSGFSSAAADPKNLGDAVAQHYSDETKQ
jgi:hypothetical protein